MPILALEVQPEQFHAEQQRRQTRQQLAVVGKRLSTETGGVQRVFRWLLTDVSDHVSCCNHRQLATRSLSQSSSFPLPHDAESRLWSNSRHIADDISTLQLHCSTGASIFTKASFTAHELNLQFANSSVNGRTAVIITKRPVLRNVCRKSMLS